MQSSIKKLPASIIELTIEESVENIAKHREKVLKNLAKTTQIKGFRKGANIPTELIIKHHGEERISQLVVDEALNTLYSKALKEHKIIPLAQGEIQEIISQSPLKVVLHIEVFPEIEVDKKYKEISLKKTPVRVTSAEVSNAMDDIKKRFTQFKASEDGYSAVIGDQIVISTQGYDASGNPLASTDMKEYPLTLGSNILVPGFEEGLVGKKAGEKVSLDITFPTDYHNGDFAGKNTKFDVEIHSISQAVAPEFTLEFIKQLRGKDLDLEGFKQLLKEEIRERKDQDARLKDENTLIDELLKISKVDYGKHMLKSQTQKVFEEVKQNIANSGAKVADYIESLGMSEEDYIESQIKPIAIRRLQAELILHKLGELEKIEISEDEINAEIANVMKNFENKEVLDRLKELYTPGTNYYEELKQRISYRKLIESFFDKK